MCIHIHLSEFRLHFFPARLAERKVKRMLNNEQAGYVDNWSSLLKTVPRAALTLWPFWLVAEQSCMHKGCLQAEKCREAGI